MAWDIKLHWSRFILIEFGLGAPAIIIFGYWLTTITFSLLLMLYILLVGVNYLVLLAYAVSIVRSNSVQRDIRTELPNQKQYIRKYGSQQFLILAPLAILALAFHKELKQ